MIHPSSYAIVFFSYSFFITTIFFSSFFFFFFFQAEDGIRDFHVTGVQTCALPICSSRSDAGGKPASAPCRSAGARRASPGTRTHLAGASGARSGAAGAAARSWHAEIGRASCRERVESSVVGVAVEKKRTGQSGKEA